jgi:hypothetical protein
MIVVKALLNSPWSAKKFTVRIEAKVHPEGSEPWQLLWSIDWVAVLKPEVWANQVPSLGHTAFHFPCVESGCLLNVETTKFGDAWVVKVALSQSFTGLEEMSGWSFNNPRWFMSDTVPTLKNVHVSASIKVVELVEPCWEA